MIRWAKEVRDRVDNEVFFANPDAPRREASIPEAVFYAGRHRPPTEVPLATRAAATPLRFAAVLFLVGWAGILFQAQFLQQVVIGAPVFEELAKLGPALLVVLAIRARSLWIRLPLAWISGAAFGVMEHYVTYSAEPLASFAQRIAFHALAPGVSILVYGAVESLPDVRARWASTIPATLLHWANNFMAIVLGIGGVFLALPDEALGLGISTIVVAALVVLTIAGMVSRERFEARVRRILDTVTPRLLGERASS